MAEGALVPVTLVELDNSFTIPLFVLVLSFVDHALVSDHTSTALSPVFDVVAFVDASFFVD